MNNVLNRESNISKWASRIKRSEMQDMLELTNRKDVISFGLGLPDPELFPNEVFSDLSHSLLRDYLVMQYGPPKDSFKTEIKKLMLKRGVNCDEDEILITSGAQQGISLLTRLLMDNNDTILTEDIIYNGFQQVIQPYNPSIVTVSNSPETGINVGELEANLKKGIIPAFLYVIPDGHNPLGVSIPMENRIKLSKLANEYNFPIIEDDPYGLLCYEEENIPSIKSFNQDKVFYVGSFSKILAPGLRTGWIVAPKNLIKKLESIKESKDINTTNLNQQLINEFLKEGHIHNQIDKLNTNYRTRRDVMSRCLSENLPQSSNWSIPRNGMFIWVSLPQEYNTLKMLPYAVKEAKVAYLPGQAFGVNEKSCLNNFRLNFSNSSISRIINGIERLGKIFN